MMVDLVSGTVVDPLQFTATLTFPTSAEHGLLESFSDATDLSTFLQRLPNEENENEEVIPSNIHSPAITPDSQLQQVDQNIENFNEQLLARYSEFLNCHQISPMCFTFVGITSHGIQHFLHTRNSQNCIQTLYLRTHHH